MMAKSKNFEVNKNNLDTFLTAFEDRVYPIILESGGVGKLEEVVAKRRKQVEENKNRRKEAARRNNKMEDI